MLNFRLYDKELDIDLDDWSKKDYSPYYNDINKYALFDESISELYQSYIDNPDLKQKLKNVILPKIKRILMIKRKATIEGECDCEYKIK